MQAHLLSATSLRKTNASCPSVLRQIPARRRRNPCASEVAPGAQIHVEPQPHPFGPDRILSSGNAACRRSRAGCILSTPRSGTTWSQQRQLTASDGEANDQFGYSVALSGDTALVGARWDDVGANPNQGSAYFYRWFKSYAPLVLKKMS